MTTIEQKEKGFPLTILLQGMPLKQSDEGWEEIGIRGIKQDSRQVKQGDLFVAIKGFKSDGHLYIQEAVERGAVAVVTEREVAVKGLPCFQVEDSRRALALMAARLYGHPSRSFMLIGVTGTNGKTTTSSMIRSLLLQAGFKTGLLGTVEMDDGLNSAPSRLTTPDSPELQASFKRMRDNGVECAVMEVSSQGLALSRVVGADFNLGVFTNLTPDHLGFHHSFSDYRQAKARFFKLLGPDKSLLYNSDHPSLVQLLSEREGPCYSFGIDSPGAAIRARDLRMEGRGTSFTIDHPSLPLLVKREGWPPPSFLRIRLQLLGRHNVYNALAAAAVGYMMGLRPEQIKAALESFEPVHRRMNYYQHQGVKIIDDTAHNPDSYRVLFDTVSQLPYRQLVLINALRGQRGERINRKNARVLASWCRKLKPKGIFITASHSSTGAGDEVTAAEKRAFLEVLEASKVGFRYYQKLGPALEAGWKAVESGDLLLLLGAQGMDQGAEKLLKKITREKKEI